MRRAHLIRSFLVVAFASALGCAGDRPTGVSVDRSAPALTARAGSAQGRQGLPLEGQCSTTFAPIPFPPPPVLRHVITGSCQLTHLGQTTLFLVQLIDFATGRITSEELTFTAANGDVLRAHEVGSGPPASGPSVTFSGTFTFDGGTGRFAHATGTATFEGGAEFITNTGFFTLDGSLAYDASDRSDK